MSENPEATQPETPPPAAPPTPPKRRFPFWRQALLGFIILLCGIMIGAGGTVLVGRRVMLRASTRQPAQVRDAIVRRMSRRLHLTPTQQTQVREIVGRHLDRLNEIRGDSRRQVQQEMDSLRDEVSQVLTPDQARAWQAQFDRMRHFAPPPPPHPPGGRPRGPHRGSGPGPDEGPRGAPPGSP